MPTIGSVWATDTWDADAWAADTWADAVAAAVEDKLPLVISDGVIEQLQSGSVLVDVVSTLTGNLMLYVDPTGSDSTGTGTVGAPYATLDRVLTRLKLLRPDKFTITVVIAAGAYAHMETFRPELSFGERVLWEGAKTTYSTDTDLVFTNYDVAYTTPAGFPELQYFEVDVTLPTGTAVVGDFIGIDDPKSGTLPTALYGVHEVVAWDNGTKKATIQVWSALGTTAIPSGANTSSGHLFQTVLEFTLTTDTAGIRVAGPHHGGIWNGVVVAGQGDGQPYDAASGILTEQGGEIEFGVAGVSNWLTGIRTQNNGYVTANSTYVSKLKASGIISSQRSGANITSSFFTGGGSQSLLISVQSQVSADAIKIIGFGRAAESVLVALSSTLVMRGDGAGSMTIAHDDGASTAVRCVSGSFINAKLITITDYNANFLTDDTSVATSFGLPFNEFRVHDAFETFLPTTAAADDVGYIPASFGSSDTLSAVRGAGGSDTAFARILVTVPKDYVDGTNLTVTSVVTEVDAAVTAATLDLEARRLADITTEIQTANSSPITVVGGATVVHTLDGTNVVIGDIIDLRFRVAQDDSGGGGDGAQHDFTSITVGYTQSTIDDATESAIILS